MNQTEKSLLVLADSSWWDNLSPDQKKAYLAQHKHSHKHNKNQPIIKHKLPSGIIAIYKNSANKNQDLYSQDRAFAFKNATENSRPIRKFIKVKSIYNPASPVEYDSDIDQAITEAKEHGCKAVRLQLKHSTHDGWIIYVFNQSALIKRP
jgi:hypothetical protein